jgi:hypothetical protein
VSGPDDALLYASLRQCLQCGRAGYGTDAVWLDDDLILASYPRSCVHVHAAVVVVDVDRVLLEIPDDVELRLPGRRCAGRNRRNAPCRAPAEPGSAFCRWHEPASRGGRGGDSEGRAR